MKKVSTYLLFAFLLFIFVLDFVIDDEENMNSMNGWDIHFGDIPTKNPGIEFSSGFIIHPSGHVLTKDHLTEHGQQIGILTSNGIDYGLTVVACDPACDLVLLRIDVPPGREFNILPIEDPDVVEAGSMDYSVPSHWVKELMNEIRSDKGELVE